MIVAITLALAWRALALVAIGATATFAYNLYHQRMRFRSLASKHGLVCCPRPPEAHCQMSNEARTSHCSRTRSCWAIS